MESTKKEQQYRDGRFDVTLYVNGNIVCRRNFSIENYIEHSMESSEFKDALGQMVKLIDDDLKSKSRVYQWYFFNPDDPEYVSELVSPLIDPWECTFKLEINDRKRPVISRIWDGYAYPKAIREKVDINNKYVKTVSRDGEVTVVDKETFFADPNARYSFDQYVLKAMIMDKGDVAMKIIEMIIDECSANGTTHETIDDYTMIESWGKDANGNDVVYNYNIKAYNRKLEKEWEKWLSKNRKG